MHTRSIDFKVDYFLRMWAVPESNGLTRVALESGQLNLVADSCEPKPVSSASYIIKSVCIILTQTPSPQKTEIKRGKN